MTDTVTDNFTHHRFELDIDGETVFAEYRQDGRALFIDHVEAPEPLRGTGAASRLMEGVMAIAEEKGYRVVPVCGYALAWIKHRRDKAA